MKSGSNRRLKSVIIRNYGSEHKTRPYTKSNSGKVQCPVVIGNLSLAKIATQIRREEAPVGQPERMRTLRCHEIGEIRALSQKENGIRGPVARNFHTV